jgi:hypothetical protein
LVIVYHWPMPMQPNGASDKIAVSTTTALSIAEPSLSAW